MQQHLDLDILGTCSHCIKRILFAHVHLAAHTHACRTTWHEDDKCENDEIASRAPCVHRRTYVTFHAATINHDVECKKTSA